MGLDEKPWVKLQFHKNPLLNSWEIAVDESQSDTQEFTTIVKIIGILQF